MALFMAYGIVITALLLVACHLGEKCLMTFRRPTRGVWILGISLAICLPAMGIVGRTPTSTSPPAYRIVGLPVATNSIPVSSPLPSPALPTRFQLLSTRLKPYDGALTWFWMTGSLLSLFALGVIAIRTRRLVARAENSVVAGAPALVTNHVGPALLGIFKYHIVVPRWVLALSAEQQSLIVTHERQHARAFDPVLVWVAALAIVAFPWNVSLWYLVRRLRTSIELDCDRRVLNCAVQAHAYASLLVDIGARVSSRVLFAAALSEPASQLQRRIRAMSSVVQPLARMRTVASAVVAFLVLGAAFRAPRPEAPLFAASRGAEAEDAGLAANHAHAISAAKRNMVTASIESQSRAPVTVLVFTTKSARIIVSGLSVTITADTLRLRTPISLTADLTDGEVHLVSTDGSVLDVTALFVDSPAAKATAQMSHVILIQGGTGVTGGKAMRPSRVSPERNPTSVGSEIEPYFEFQVEKPATQIPGSGSPQYPDVLRAAGVEGEVQAQFVVNENGNVEFNTFKVLRSASFGGRTTRGPSMSTDDMFAAAVREALRNMRFSPAEIGGRHVRQLVQQAFMFKLDARPRSAVNPVLVEGDRVADSVSAMARRFEPTVFDRKLTPGSAVIGLLIDANGSVVHHSRLPVPDTTRGLRVLMPRLFPNMHQVERAPYQVMSLVDGSYAGRSVQVVAVFMRKPVYAPDDR